MVSHVECDHVFRYSAPLPVTTMKDDGVSRRRPELDRVDERSDPVVSVWLLAGMRVLHHVGLGLIVVGQGRVAVWTNVWDARAGGPQKFGGGPEDVLTAVSVC